MGKYKFKLSDMIPNAWFYKMRDMNRNNRSRNSQPNSNRNSRRSFSSPITTPKQSAFIPNRASNYYPSRAVEERKHLNSPANSPKRVDTKFPLEPPRKSTRRSPRRRVKLISPSRSDGRDCREKITSRNDGIGEFDPCKVSSSSADIIIDLSDKKNDNYRILGRTKNKKAREIFDLRLPPILTRSDSSKKIDLSPDIKNERTQLRKWKSPRPARKVSMRIKSPRVSQKSTARSEIRSNESFKESYAVVKSSNDPQRDFRESMVEMIVENNMRSLDDLEELLACYLSLNSREYHVVILNVFKQIWLDLLKFQILE